MIRITITSGRFAGRTREMPASMDPAKMFASLIRHGDQWETDYAAGTEEEVFAWFRAEIVARIIRALQEGRPVKFLDREFRLEAGGDLLSTGQAVEDAIVASGRLITINSDDEKGLVIGEAGYEQ
ncbi:MAG: hypothetical protein Q8O93_05655 [bacterium]|nr:hypothetical protein [bacterium]